uniref:Retrovirus-related Pol polyprotein from transposon TNT 1-94 n=1 Tax=Tanacetum cinerariifolium TaxID=118510 RepID=A0A6L2K1H4_TANCI|nr:retrovirus-related Pol polyprotein from transposon TNT 1-94 [Tanacetum cinerariifolium]
MKFLRSLPSEWNTHAIVWRNKADLDTISIDDLYNNFKIIKQEVKRTVPKSSSSRSQNMAFLSSLGSTNEVYTTNIKVSIVSTPVSNRTGKKITIDGSDTASYDKTKVECFTCHNMGHFAREYKSPRNQKSRPRNQDSSRKTVNVEDTSSKALAAIDGAGFDWSYMADDEVPTNMALMAFSDSKAYLHPELLICLTLVLRSSNTLNLKDIDLRPMVQKPALKNVEKETGQREVRPVWTNTMRINHQNFSSSKKKFAPTAVLTRSEIVPISTARQSSSREAATVSAARIINTAAPKPLVNVAKPRQNALQKSHSLSRRPFYQQTTLKNRNLNNKINIAKVNSVNTAKGNRVTSVVGKQGINVVKSSACWVWRPKIKGDPQDDLKDQGYFNSEYSRHMTRNISYLTDFKEHDRGYVAFRGGSKGGKITGKGTIRIEFKNSVMNEFCEEKCIKREYNVVRTPQQNRVTEKRSMTLIEVARAMLADFKLPTIFYAKAVNTACYVQNRVLVVKPHFKTPYELFRGRSHALSFMRPFGCHVTILNTLDQLGEFDGKSDEGIFVGYSTISKAFRVYNIKTRKVEENLHITFLENKPMITCGGLEWLFDIDALSESMNYAPVPAGTNSNDFAGKGASFDAGQSSLETRRSQNYILLPPWKDSSLFDFFLQDSDSHNQDNLNINIVSPSVNTATPTYADYPSDPLMPDLKDTRIFDDAYDDRDEGAEADYNNLEIVISVSPIPSTRVHKDHPKQQITGEIHSVVQTRKMAKQTEVGIEAIRLFLAYASFMDFTMYQIDVKSAFLYGTIKEEVYVSQPSGFVDPEFPVRVYKVEKALYDLHQAPRAWPDITFVVRACSRFQVQLKVSHMHDVKRIFRYLKGQPTLGLWYPKESPLELITYSGSDYAGASLDRKSTTEGCQFLGSRLISWQCKKQTIMANSITEAEYIAASNCYGQTNHIEIRRYFIRDSYEKRLIKMVKIHTDYHVADLLTTAFDVTWFQVLIASICLLNP